MTSADESWNDTVLVWNGLVAGVPALVVRPESRDELAAAVAFARDHGLRLGIARGPIEDTAGSAAERRVTLDLSARTPP